VTFSPGGENGGRSAACRSVPWAPVGMWGTGDGRRGTGDGGSMRTARLRRALVDRASGDAQRLYQTIVLPRVRPSIAAALPSRTATSRSPVEPLIATGAPDATSA